MILFYNFFFHFGIFTKLKLHKHLKEAVKHNYFLVLFTLKDD